MLRIPRGQRRSDETTLRPHAVVLFLFGSCTRNQRSRWYVAPAQPPLARCGLGAGMVAVLPLCCLVQVRDFPSGPERCNASRFLRMDDGWPRVGLSPACQRRYELCCVQVPCTYWYSTAPISPVVYACTCTAQQAPGPLPGSSKCLLTCCSACTATCTAVPTAASPVAAVLLCFCCNVRT